MDTSGTINRKQFTRLSLFIITLLLFLVPSVNEGNPLPVPMFISEFSVNPDSLERIELFVWDNGYGLENLDGFYVETNGGTFDLLDGLTIPDTGYVLLSESSFVGDFRLGDTSGYIDVRDQYHY